MIPKPDIELAGGMSTPARRCAFAVVRRVFEDGAYADRVFRTEAERARLAGRERSFAMQLAYGTIQRRATLDHLIADEQHQTGTVDHTPVYPREVVKRALELSATAVILVHNHPSGDPTPSRADIEMTRAIVEVARPLGIAVHDHLIVGKDGHASLKALKLI